MYLDVSMSGSFPNILWDKKELGRMRGGGEGKVKKGKRENGNLTSVSVSCVCVCACRARQANTYVHRYTGRRRYAIGVGCG